MLSPLLLVTFILTPFVITTPRGGTHPRGRCTPTFIRTHPVHIAKNQIQLYRKKGTYVIRERGGHHQEESRKGVNRDKRGNGSSSDHRGDTQPKGESTPIHKHQVKKHHVKKHYVKHTSSNRRGKKKYTKEEVKAEKERQLRGKLRRKKIDQGILKKGKKRGRRVDSGDGGEEVEGRTDLASGPRGDSPNEGKANGGKANEGPLSRRRNRGRRTPSRKEQKILDMFQNDLNESIERLNKKTRKYELCRQNENLKSGMQGNEILRKVLAAGGSAEGRSGSSSRSKRSERRERKGSPPRAEAVQKNPRIVRYVDDISDDTAGGQTKHSDERTQKESNAEEEVELYSSPHREGRTHKGNTHRREKKKTLEQTNMTKLSRQKGRSQPQEDYTDEQGRTNQRNHNDQVEGENVKQVKALIKIGKSIDPFRKRIHIDYDRCALSDVVRRRLAKFSSIIDLNATGGEKRVAAADEMKATTADATNATTEKCHTFADIGICDHFLNAYLKYNGIDKPTEYQAKFIPLLIFFLNNGYSDWGNCSGGGSGQMGEASNFGGASPEGTPSTQSKQSTPSTPLITQTMQTAPTGSPPTRGAPHLRAYPPVERILYVNKYNERSGKLIRTFFLHCPTGTGKTFMYVLSLFQHLTNVCFAAPPRGEETKQGDLVGVDVDSEATSCAAITSYETTPRGSAPQEGNTFYVRKEINGDVTSFLCSNVKQEQQHFVSQNRRNVAAMVNALTKRNPPGEVKPPSCDDHMGRRKRGNLSERHPKNDILIVTYNKELAVQIYHLCRDLIDSFFKSSKSKFFELNDSLVWSHLQAVDPQRKTLLERLNVDFKKKKNFNVHLLIGGNNIKYQLKGLKRPKMHLEEESPQEGGSSGGRRMPSEESPPEEDFPPMKEDPIEHVNIYVGTPGRLERLINERQIITLDSISTIVFDEYDFVFHSYGKGSEETKADKPQVENEFFSKMLRSIYGTMKKGQPGRGPLPPWTSLTNVICCSATPAVYSYLTFTRHIITTNFLRHLHGGGEAIGKQSVEGEAVGKEAVEKDAVGKDAVEKDAVGKDLSAEGEPPGEGYPRGKSPETGNRPPIDRQLEQRMLNELFDLKEFGKIPHNLIHLNYTYDRSNREWSNSATMNFLNILFSTPLRKNVLVFCNTKKRVMDLWSLFRNRFDVDIQTIFAEKNKKRKKIFKDINYANFFKNDLVDYKNLKKYVNFMFLSTNLLYRGINCMGFTTIVNFDMPSGPIEYVHRCGRIGRINNKGIIINIFEKSFRRTYRRRIFSKLGIHPYDVDCYMNNLFTLGGEEVQRHVGKEGVGKEEVGKEEVGQVGGVVKVDGVVDVDG
ncbi:hypothetical protein PVMG_04377, partial [Plasmodium vivax Mauritania I]